MASANVLVLVLNHNAGATLEGCLRSLQASTYPAKRIVVLDNGSTDESAEIPKRLGIEVHPNGANLGYCAAYNRAFQGLGGNVEFVLLSNPDVEVPPPTIEQMVSVAAADDRIAFVGPVQRHADTKTIRSAGIRWRCGRMPHHVTTPGEKIEALEGAFLLVRRSAHDHIGGLDEALALNLEDVDWQLRARAAGYRSVLAPEAEILHHRPGRTRIATGAYYQTRNACILTERHCGGAPVAALRRRLLIEGLLARALGRPRGRYILEGLRDHRDGVGGMKSTEGAR